jgi:hypothetical protein
MAVVSKTKIRMGGPGGGRVYFKKDWLWMAGVDPTDKADVEAEIDVDKKNKEIIIRILKKPGD